jgi:hypothetical protein
MTTEHGSGNGAARVYDGPFAEQSYHELGHLFLHALYGHEVKSVEVGENFGRCTLTPQTVNPFDYIISLCGGRAAVGKWYGWRKKKGEAWRASSDYKTAYEVALKVSEGDHEAAGHLMRWAERIADAEIQKHWTELHEPARMLARVGRLNGERIGQILYRENTDLQKSVSVQRPPISRRQDRAFHGAQFMGR